MRSSTPANPKRRRRRTSIAALLALCALAGVQAIAPASAGAAENQSTTCLNMPPQGFTEPVPGMGWDPVGGYACKLDSGGAYYGGTGTTKKDSAPTAPICTGRDCLPGSQHLSPDPWGDMVDPLWATGPSKGKKATPTGQKKTAKKLTEKECRELDKRGAWVTPNPQKVERYKAEILNIQIDRLKTHMKLGWETDPLLKQRLKSRFDFLTQEAKRMTDYITSQPWEDWQAGGCTQTIYEDPFKKK
jgi:hypothetical protein